MSRARAEEPLFLGVDLGTSALKCGLHAATGGRAGFARIAYPTYEGVGGSEQRCDDWWRALASGVRGAIGPLDRGRIVAIGVGGHAPSPVFVDSDLRPVAPVWPWCDGRSDRDRERLLESLGGAPEQGGGRLMVHTAARAIWLRRAAPDDWARTACILQSGDYLIARMTGRRVITSPRAVDVLVAADLPPSLIPERACNAGEPVAGLAAHAAAELGLEPGLVVVAGGTDSFLASIGGGLRTPGDACVNTGSQSVVALLARPGPAARFEWAGSPLHSRPVRMGARRLEWARRPTGVGGSFTSLLLEAARARPSTSAPQALIEFMSKADRDDRECHRAFLDLARDRSPRETLGLLLRAVFLAQRTVLEDLERAVGPVHRIRVVGGLAEHPEINQMQSDVFDRVVEVPSITESGAFGAAMLAVIALGLRTPMDAARMNPTRRFHWPRPDFAAAHSSLYAELNPQPFSTVLEPNP